MTDVLLYQTPDDGDINIVDGVVELTDDFRTSVYLSLFGGNEDDDGRDDSALSWWGNIGATEPAERYTSETQNLLNTLPPSTGNLLRLEDASRRDLKWMLDTGAVSELDVAVTMPELNNAQFVITLNGDETVEFIENWKAA